VEETGFRTCEILRLNPVGGDKDSGPESVGLDYALLAEKK
jgi:hypothetical protein